VFFFLFYLIFILNYGIIAVQRAALSFEEWDNVEKYFSCLGILVWIGIISTSAQFVAEYQQVNSCEDLQNPHPSESCSVQLICKQFQFGATI